MQFDEDRLKLTQLLHALLIDYWHDVDTNWGRNAPDYYTEGARFVGSAAANNPRPIEFSTMAILVEAAFVGDRARLRSIAHGPALHC